MMKSKWRVALIAIGCAVALGVAASCSKPIEPPRAATVAAADDAPAPSGFAKALDAYFAQQLPPDEPGGAVLVMKHERVVFSRGYGLADLKTHQAVTPKTLFNLGSISKTFVAGAILLLQEQGKLSVDDNLLKYFPAFKNKDLASRVTLRHMLTHTSGLPDIREVDKNPTFYLTARMQRTGIRSPRPKHSSSRRASASSTPILRSMVWP